MTLTTRSTYTGNGATTDFTISFSYIDRSHVYVSINSAVTTAFSFFNSTTIRFDSAPAAGASIVIYRVTPFESILADFTPGGALREQDLELDLNQLLYCIQETSTNLALTTITANTALSNQGVFTRVDTSYTTGILAQDGVADFTMNLGKLSELIAIKVSQPSWVRFYRSSAQRAADTRVTAGGSLQAIINMGDSKPYSENVTVSTLETITQNPVPLLQGDGAGLVYVRLIKKSTGSSAVTITTTTHPQEH